MSDWQIEEEWGSVRVDILIMEAGASVSPCFSAAGTSCHDLHEVFTSVTMIRSHQGLRTYGQRRHGGKGLEGMTIKSRSAGKSNWKKRSTFSPFFYLHFCIFSNRFGFALVSKILMNLKSLTWKMADSRLPQPGTPLPFESNGQVYWQVWRWQLWPPLFSGCSLYKLKLDAAPTPSDYMWFLGRHESFHLKILGFCCQHIYILSCMYLQFCARCSHKSSELERGCWGFCWQDGLESPFCICFIYLKKCKDISS